MYNSSNILTETKLVTTCLSPIKNGIFKDANFGTIRSFMTLVIEFLSGHIKIEYMQIVIWSKTYWWYHPNYTK